jgi:signal transduction histidine kinase
VQVSSGVLRDPEGGLAGGVFVLRDLRSEREVERMKNEFLAHIGHELRTPLTPLIGYSELIARKEFPPEQVRSLNEEILNSARRLQRIIELLEFVASTGAGRLPLRPEILNFRTLADEAVDRWADKVDGHSLTRRVGRGLPEVVADPRWIKVSIDELLDNAVKFSPNGGKIDLSVAVADNGKGPGVEISVQDRGIGMDEQQQSEAFGEFVQGDGSDTRSYGGLGLGLNLVQRVAEAHGGEVTCTSEPGKGTTFSIFLPGAPKTKRKRTRR